jgi:hypothetical protein
MTRRIGERGGAGAGCRAGHPTDDLRPMPSGWGHLAGFGANPPDNEFIDAALDELLRG